jgi:uncharacterized 2Fe-2S/4Fe-4S cluster protein (DUF4445 family)
LIPELPDARFLRCGNTSLAGVRALLLNPGLAATVDQIVDRSRHVELAMLPQFQQVFAQSMYWGSKSIS